MAHSPHLRIGVTAMAAMLIVCLPPAARALSGASREPVRASHGMVGSTEAHATRIGVEILRRGGNAVDAAVAVGFALAVTHPQAGNLGGGGFMVLRLPDGRETTIDYREVAPAAATRDMFLDDTGNPVRERSLTGPLAAGVPGSVAGLLYAHQRYGRLPLPSLIAPAGALARDGFEVSWQLSQEIEASRSRLAMFPATSAIFLTPAGLAPEPGTILRQPDLARTIAAIAAHGSDGFYDGATASAIADEMKRSGGLITREDLARYRPVERPPVVGTYRGLRIVSMGPPSSGGIALIQLLNLLEAFPLHEYGANSSRTMHLMIEAERRTYADRSEWLGDPAFTRVPVAGLISKRYAESLRTGVDPLRATPSAQVKPGDPVSYESSETTHYSIVDADGGAVSVTTTLNGSFGNAQVVPGTGMLLNNEMDDFSAKPGTPNMFGLLGGAANAIEPRKRMLSSMTPTIVVRDGRTWLVLGSPGGGRIITTVLQVILNVVDHGMDVQEAVDAPRFHHQWQPDEVVLESRGFPADVVDALDAMGHTLRVGPDSGDVPLIAIDPASGVRLGAADPRLDGVTQGY